MPRYGIIIIKLVPIVQWQTIEIQSLHFTEKGALLNEVEK